MAIRRVPIENLSEPGHRPIFLRGEEDSTLPKNKVYVDPTTGRVLSGQRGDKLRHLLGREIELPLTTWYLDRDRLGDEIREVQRILGPDFQLYMDDEKGLSSWESFFWMGHHPGGPHVIRASYSPLHPLEQMRISTIPDDLDTHHRLGDGSLCYLKPQEWSPDWTAATALGQAIRFLTDYYEGRV